MQWPDLIVHGATWRAETLIIGYGLSWRQYSCKNTLQGQSNVTLGVGSPSSEGGIVLQGWCNRLNGLPSSPRQRGPLRASSDAARAA